MSLQERKLKKYIIKQLRKDKKLKMYLININWIRIRKQKERRRRKTLIKLWKIERLRELNLLKAA
jgi:hypothetical protein